MDDFAVGLPDHHNKDFYTKLDINMQSFYNEQIEKAKSDSTVREQLCFEPGFGFTPGMLLCAFDPCNGCTRRAVVVGRLSLQPEAFNVQLSDRFLLIYFVDSGVFAVGHESKMMVLRADWATAPPYAIRVPCPGTHT